MTEEEDHEKNLYVVFYPDTEAQGGAFRETLKTKGLCQTDGRLLRRAKFFGMKLKAKSFVIFKAIPRVWLVDEEAEE